MLGIILKIVGSLFGIIAAWYISMKIAGWLSALQQKWDQFKAEQLKNELSEHKKDEEFFHDSNRKKMDDFLGGPGAS